jgi:hypothetical protein
VWHKADMSLILMNVRCWGDRAAIKDYLPGTGVTAPLACLA